LTDDDNNNVDIDLDTFENEFFGEAKAEPQEEAVVEEVEEVDENEDNSLATDEDEDVEAEEIEEEDEAEEEPEPEPQPKQKRNRAQERIEKLVAEARQAERERDALRIELERLRSEDKEVKKEEAPKLREQLPAEAPDPDAKDEKGEPIYELGEFDPKFIRDLTKFTIEMETKAAKERAKQEEQAKMIAQAQEEIKTKWLDNLEKAEAELPTIREDIHDLVDVFSDIEPNYGEYLASTIMASDFGPQMMHYLSQNIGEAQKIVASGPAAATLAIGRLEAKFYRSSEPEEKRNTKQVSKAAEPPENRTRGHGGRFTVAPDTDNLDAFEREFFK